MLCPTSNRRFVPTTEVAFSLDHLVGEHEKRRRNREAERRSLGSSHGLWMPREISRLYGMHQDSPWPDGRPSSKDGIRVQPAGHATPHASEVPSDSVLLAMPTS
jgi:hypothetical protein